jgi:hypothetical protein
MNAKSVTTMDRAWLNYIAKLPLITPIDNLKSRPRIPQVKRRRAIPSQREREIVDACIFCSGLSRLMKREVWVIDDEDADYDFVAFWHDDYGNDCFVPVQLKEVVPTHLNPHASIQSVIDSLAKYGSPNLSVVIRVNQRITLDLDEITIPSRHPAALWVCAPASEDGSRWLIAGNLVEPEPNLILFDYPAQ